MASRSDTTAEGPDDGLRTGEESDTDEESLAPLSKDTVFELLKNQRRRYVLRYLAEDPGPARLRDLAERIAAWENDKPIGALSSDERKRVYVGLYQCHLTKMDDAGVVVFNQDRGLVTLGERASVLYGYLEPSRSGDGSWSVAYLGFAAVSAVFTLLVEAGLLAGSLSGSVLTGIVVVGFSLIALTHAATVSVLDVESPAAALDAVGGTFVDTDRS